MHWLLPLSTALWTCIALASDKYLVQSLPEAQHIKKTKMHAGELPVDHHRGTLFFWRHEAEHPTEDTPVIIWLNGGPGCSSMDGAMLEVSPIRARTDGSLRHNPYSWTKYGHLLFIDQPVGTGFSSMGNGGYVLSWKELTLNLGKFMNHYFQEFPEDQRRRFIIAGESYAGQYIPYFADYVRKNNLFDVRGLMIGNGYVDPKQDLSLDTFAAQHQLIRDPLQVTTAKQTCMDDITKCDLLNNIFKVFRSHNRGECFNMYNYKLRDSYPACGMNWPPELTGAGKYLNRDDVKAALHIPSNMHWQECNTNIQRWLAEPKPYGVELIPSLSDTMPVLLFNGVLDVICNYMGTEAMLAKMMWGTNQSPGFGSTTPIPWIGGNWYQLQNIMYTRVSNASHMVPYDQPQLAQEMLRIFLNATQT